MTVRCVNLSVRGAEALLRSLGKGLAAVTRWPATDQGDESGVLATARQASSPACD